MKKRFNNNHFGGKVPPSKVSHNKRKGMAHHKEISTELSSVDSSGLTEILRIKF